MLHGRTEEEFNSDMLTAASGAVNATQGSNLTTAVAQRIL